MKLYCAWSSFFAELGQAHFKYNLLLLLLQKPYGLLETGRRGEDGMEVGGERDYIPIATPSPPE